MSSIPVTIVLHGLVALVPAIDVNNTSNHMTALLVDATQLSAHQCVAQHFPSLDFVPQTLADCVNAGCNLSGSTCSCTTSLAGIDISLSVQPPPALPRQRLNKSPQHPLPLDVAINPSEAIDFAYVANLAQTPIGATLNPSYLGTPPPGNLLARMAFDFESVAACALAAREDEGLANAHAMTFRALQARGSVNEPNQAMAQVVLARLTVPDAPPDQQSVTLRLHSFSGATDRSIVLRPGAAEQGYKIELSNDIPPPGLSPDDPCDDGVARHFAYFYELALNPPAWDARPVPHMKFTSSKPRRYLTSDACSVPDFFLMDRPACPMGSFY